MKIDDTYLVMFQSLHDNVLATFDISNQPLLILNNSLIGKDLRIREIITCLHCKLTLSGLTYTEILCDKEAHVKSRILQPC